MSHLLQLALIIFSGATIALADGLVKRVANASSSMTDVLVHPFMIAIVGIYLLQIITFGFVFLRSWDLGITGIMQIITYTTVVVLIGIIFFQEKLTFIHGLGMLFALSGAVLMNL